MERTGEIIQFAIPPPSLARLPNCFSIAKPGREIKYYPVNVPPFVRRALSIRARLSPSNSAECRA